MARPTNNELDEKSRLAEQGLKRCRNCREVFPLGSFGALKRAADGLQPWCKSCVNARNGQYDRASRERDPELYRKRKNEERHRFKELYPEKHRAHIRKNNLKKYGLTPEAFDEMFALQGGKCAICQIELTEGRGTHIDHSHDTGEVRGLLCGGCNVGIGQFRDLPELLRAAARYIEG